METGGGFGGKEEYPSMIAGHAALLAWKSGKPVKMIYDRAEDMVATTKRHPSVTRHRTAVSNDGKLLAMDIDFAIDGGAYATLSPVVLSRGTIHAAGPVLVPERARAQPGGGDELAAARRVPRLRRAAEHLRARAAHGPRRRRGRADAGRVPPPQFHAPGRDDRDRPGDPASRSTWTALLERALALTDYHAKRERFAAQNPTARVKKGIGFATFMHGAGFTGSGEDYLARWSASKPTPDGRVRDLAASTEIGQGTNTILARSPPTRWASPYDSVEIAQPDTAACRTAARRWRRARAWSWASWWNRRRSG